MRYYEVSKKLIENKEIYTSKENNEKAIPITQNSNNSLNNSQVIYPIISDGDAIGSVILLSKDSKTKICRCRICNNLSEDEICTICSDKTRDDKTICVVESIKNIIIGR